MLNLNDILLLARLLQAWEDHQQAGTQDWTALLIAHGEDVIRLVALVCTLDDAGTLPLDEAVRTLNERLPAFIEGVATYLGEQVMPGIGQLQSLVATLSAPAPAAAPTN